VTLLGGPDDAPVTELPAVEAPVATIVMVTYGARQWVSRAIDALVAHTPPIYELVVVDNASPDGTADWLGTTVRGLTLVRNDRNVGFGPGANQGALIARGRLLCFLNSDAMVEPGWLDPIVETLDSVPGAGAVVPMFLNLDGTLQEAGAVVSRDGGTLSIGYGDDPEKPQYRFRRFVTYGSGAGLVLPRSTFLHLGGFDPRYGLGYFEDVDLCFELASHGLQTVYEPRSRVRHVRGGSSLTEEMLSLRDANVGLFRERWEAVLDRHPDLGDLPAYPHRVIAARDVDAPDRILVVSDRLPSDLDAPVAQLAADIIALCPRARVTVMGLDHVDPAEHLLPLCDRGVELVWGVTDWDDWLSLRMFHYSVVVVGGSAARRIDFLLRRTQPQAQRAYLVGLEPSSRQAGPAPNVLRGADAVWCGSEDAEEEARALAPLDRSFVVGDGKPAMEETLMRSRGLRAALAAFGIAPEGCG
jgi:GT2 family glycosyltransferase